MDGYTAKPIDPDHLFTTLDQVQQGLSAAESVLAIDSVGQHDADMSESEEADVVDFQAATSLIPGGIAAVKRLAQTFLEECPRLMEEIRGGLADQDPARLQRGAHTLKSSAGVFSAKRVVTVAERLESMGREGSLGDAPHALAKLEKEVGRLGEAIRSATTSASVDDQPTVNSNGYQADHG